MADDTMGMARDEAAKQERERSLREDYVICYACHELWWRPDARGYTTNLADAGVFTKEDAERRARPDADTITPLRDVLDLLKTGTVGALLKGGPQ